MNMNKTWKAVFGVILIYLFGCFSGAVSTSLFSHHKTLGLLQHPAMAVTVALEKSLTGNLGLDASQKRQVHEYFLENLRRRKELQMGIEPQVQMLNRQTFQQVAAILRPDQAERFRQNVEQLRKRLAANASNQDAENPSAPQVQPASPTTRSGAGSSP